MYSRQKKVFEKRLPKSLVIFKWLITLLLVLSLVSCGEKAVSKEVTVGYSETPQKISQQFTEVSPPDVIQELRPALEKYRPQVTIITPKSEEIILDNTATVSFQVKDLPIFKNPELELGPHLHVILDNQPYIPVYDLNQPLVLSDLSPGTHTLRVFASRPWHESFKNEGAYAQTTFHVFTKTDDNQPDQTLPLLTYSRPQGSYGAEPILLDFYLTNAPLHIVGKDNPNDTMSDWRIRCTINGESFVFDRWEAVYLKRFKPGKNWVKLEFLDNQGNPVKNAFNTTVRLVNYQPKGQDTLSRIVRGELKADEARGIVDQNYTFKTPEVEATPTPTVEPVPPTKVEEKPAIPEVEVPKIPETQPEVTPVPEIVAPEAEKSQPSPDVAPTAPVVTPTPEATEVPETVAPEAEKPQPSPDVTPTAPEVSPTPQASEVPEVSPAPTPEVTEAPQPEVTPSAASRLGKYFQRRPRPTVSPSPTVEEPQEAEKVPND